MSMRKVWATRVANSTAETYVGKQGTIFFNELTGALRISDGVTVGGQPLTLVASDFAFQFGDFVATTETVSPFGATLMAVDDDQDINIVSNGTGRINVIGEFSIYKTDGDVPGALSVPALFSVLSDGQVAMYVTQGDLNAGAVSITGSDSGTVVPPGLTGAMLHITGQLADPCRLYYDGNGDYVAVNHRRWNGSLSAGRTQVLAGEDIMRLNATAQTDAGMGSVAIAQIRITALEDQFAAAQGGKITFTATAIGTPASSRVDVATVTVEDGISATKFTGPLTGNVTGKADTAGTADIATTVTLVATNSTAATHYLTFVDAATGNENVRTDTDLTYNPSTNTLFVPRLQSKLYRYTRDAGTIGAGGTLTLDFSVDDVVHCTWGDGMTLAYQNYTAGSVIRLMATKTSGGNDPINLDGVTAANVSNGATVTANYTQGTTAFIELTCISTTIGSVYVKL